MYIHVHTLCTRTYMYVHCTVTGPYRSLCYRSQCRDTILAEAHDRRFSDVSSQPLRVMYVDLLANFRKLMIT